MIPEADRPTSDAGSHRGHVDNIARFLSEHLPEQSKTKKNPPLKDKNATSLKDVQLLKFCRTILLVMNIKLC